jgi:hypothetical protein
MIDRKEGGFQLTGRRVKEREKREKLKRQRIFVFGGEMREGKKKKGTYKRM